MSGIPKDSIAGTHFGWSEALHNSWYTKVPLLMRRAVIRHARNLERLRTRINAERKAHGLPPTGITILSWIRSPAKNRSVGGASKSRHMSGDATDIAREEVNRLCPWPNGRRDFDRIANQVFAKGGFGTYPGGNRHVDSRGFFARWTSWTPGR